MAKRRVKAPSGTTSTTASSPTPSSCPPQPHDPLQITLTPLEQGATLHRVHLSQYQADQFNPGVHGDARFSPIKNNKGNPIPTLYAGQTMACALMETIFHDIPYTPGFKSLDKSKLNNQMHSTIHVEQEIQLADLSSTSLRKLGVERKHLIDTEKDQYPNTRKWAEAIHHQNPSVQGLTWISRQDDNARAYILFEDRITPGALKHVGDSQPLLDGDNEINDTVLDLAEKIGVAIV